MYHPLLIVRICVWSALLLLNACLPPSNPYPHRPPQDVVNEAIKLSDSLEKYIVLWTEGKVPAQIPARLIPDGISDSKNFYLKHPDDVTPEETWATRFAKPINKDSLYAGIPDPKITYLLLGTSLAPFGSKLIIEGEFPHCRFFSIQVTPPLNGSEYYAQRQFGSAEVSLVDADIQPLPGHTNPFRVGANRNATNRKYKVEVDLTTGNPTTLNGTAHTYPYRTNNSIKGALLTYQGPLGFQYITGNALPDSLQGPWDLGNVWIRIYEPDNNVNALGGVPMPKVYFELPNGQKYFIGSDFSNLTKRANATIKNRVVITQPNQNIGPSVGWFKSWSISRSILNGICITNNWTDSAARVRAIDLGWTGRGENQPAPGNIEPHATTNNYVSYMGRTVTVPPGMVAVLTGKLPTFPSTRNGEATMTAAELRYWSICGIDQDPFSPLPATTVHAISDDDVALDNNRNYVIAYSRPTDRPSNATITNGVSWVDWGTQSELGLLIRWLCVAPDWRFPLAPHEHNLDFAHSDFSATLYDKTLVGQNWRNGFMKCYLPKIHFMTKAQFEAIGSNVSAENVPVWVNADPTTIGLSESKFGAVTSSGTADATAGNAAQNVIDGNLNSAWGSPLGSQNATITVDLIQPKVISAIKLHWDWVFYAKNYSIETSTDNVNFTVLTTITGSNGAVDLYDHLANVKARYVRLNLTQLNTLYYRLLEFEVYTNDCDCLPTLPTSTQHVTPEIDATVYPNPSVDFVTIQVPEMSYAKIKLISSEGKVLLEATSYTNSTTLLTERFSPGVYLIQIETDRGKTSKRLIIS
ncbi:MAG: discoidin domain-containing protein [Cytophagaceae bacterium]|jgi:hypothetical protein|nr:discoidin domain-containing protein [Cytophagaceae bacterium]